MAKAERPARLDRATRRHARAAALARSVQERRTALRLSQAERERLAKGLKITVD